MLAVEAHLVVLLSIAYFSPLHTLEARGREGRKEQAVGRVARGSWEADMDGVCRPSPRVRGGGFDRGVERTEALPASHLVLVCVHARFKLVSNRVHALVSRGHTRVHLDEEAVRCAKTGGNWNRPRRAGTPCTFTRPLPFPSRSVDRGRCWAVLVAGSCRWCRGGEAGHAGRRERASDGGSPEAVQTMTVKNARGKPAHALLLRAPPSMVRVHI